MTRRDSKRRIVTTTAVAGLLVAGVAAVTSAGAQPASAPLTATTAVTAQDSSSPYQSISSSGARSIPRGQWVDLTTYRTPTGGPITHNMQLALEIDDASGTRPTFVKVSWVRDKGSGWDRTGSAVVTVPSRGGDNPFFITHEHTIGSVKGPAKAQVYVQGSGSVTLKSWTVQAIAFPSY